jgi:DNA-binding response OmpR family regulator
MTLPKILIVDDDRTTSTLLSTLFELEGFEVVTHPQPDTVLEKARALCPDILLIDCHLANRDGLAVLRALRADADFEPVPVVMTSGLDRSAECMRDGASAFVMKPFAPSDLIDLVRSLIGPARKS